MANNANLPNTDYIIHRDGSVHLTHTDMFGVVSDMPIDPVTAMDLANAIMDNMRARLTTDNH